MEVLTKFMEERGIPEATIEHFRSENLDPSSILIMPDEQFEKILPKMGDRIAVYNFCKKHIVPKKQSLIERLKGKIEEKNKSGNVESPKVVIKKPTRVIEVGWVCSLDGAGGYIHVRKLQGGGTRQITIDRTAKVELILQKAVELFFPNGVSSKGLLSEFDVKLVDFQLNDLDQNLTVDVYFTLTALTKLRFYLASKIQLNCQKTNSNRKHSGSPVKRRRRTGKASVINCISSDDCDNDDRKDGKQDVPLLSTSKESVADLRGSEKRRRTSVSEINYILSSDDYNDDKDKKQNDPSLPISDESMVHPDRDNLLPLISNELDQDLFDTFTNREQEPPVFISDRTSTANEDFAILVNSILDEYDTANVYPAVIKESNNSNLRNEPRASLTLAEILDSLRLNINLEKVSNFNVFREDVFGCCVRAMNRKTFSPFHSISVKFSDTEGVSEGAVDAGGPSREMFRLVLNHIMESQMFCGGKKKHLSLCARALEEQQYFEAGRLIALSLLHGGPAPHFFSETLFACLTSNENHHPSLSDVPDDIKSQLKRLNEAKDLNEMQDVLLSSDIFSVAGFSFIRNENEKSKIIERTLKFFAVQRIQDPLKQFIRGLETCHIYDKIKDYLDLFKPVVCDDKIRLTAETFEKLFKITYSDTGSNFRSTENRIITFFRDYILDCEEESESTIVVTLEDILVFATGADCLPPLGFPQQPQITFMHGENVRYPMANTCALHFKLPTVHKKYEEFKSDLDFGIGNCKSFGFA